MIYNKLLIVFSSIALLCMNCDSAQSEDEQNFVEYDSIVVPEFKESRLGQAANKFINAYPDYFIGKTDSSIIWFDSTEMLLDDKISNKSFDSLLNYPDLEDQLSITYKNGKLDSIPSFNSDPGRIRYQPFFEKMYGSNKTEVRAKLNKVIWLPGIYDQELLVTSVNNISWKISQISKELAQKPELHKYLKDIGGTFNWRKISGTNRLSSHSFGIAIDISTRYSNYWKWSAGKDKGKIKYKNQIPFEIVKIFEKYGFIWGGKWYHYDTMHFEYRPELLI